MLTLRYVIGSAALLEIRRQQRQTQTILPRAPFERVVRETATEQSLSRAEVYRFQPQAIDALCEAAEVFLVAEFESMSHTVIGF